MTTIANPVGTAAGATPKADQQREKLKGAAQQFEAVFLRQMISSMRSASLGEDILGSDASNQFRDMSDARLADSMAERGTIGVAEMLLKQFSSRIAPEAKAGEGVDPAAQAASPAKAAE